METSIRQLDAELAVAHKTIYRRVRHSKELLDAPQPQLERPVDIDELYISE